MLWGRGGILPWRNTQNSQCPHPILLRQRAKICRAKHNRLEYDTRKTFWQYALSSGIAAYYLTDEASIPATPSQPRPPCSKWQHLAPSVSSSKTCRRTKSPTVRFQIKAQGQERWCLTWHGSGNFKPALAKLLNNFDICLFFVSFLLDK